MSLKNKATLDPLFLLLVLISGPQQFPEPFPRVLKYTYCIFYLKTIIPVLKAPAVFVLNHPNHLPSEAFLGLVCKGFCFRDCCNTFIRILLLSVCVGVRGGYIDAEHVTSLAKVRTGTFRVSQSSVLLRAARPRSCLTSFSHTGSWMSRRVFSQADPAEH